MQIYKTDEYVHWMEKTLIYFAESGYHIKQW